MAERPSSESIVIFGSSIPGLALSDVSLQEVLEVICLGVPGSSVAEITLLEKKQADVAVAIGQVSSRGAAIPYRERGGPRLDAYQRRVVNRIDSTDTDPRWPEFCDQATAIGVHSIISFPMVFAGGDLGTLTVYSNTESGFDERAERAGTVFAALASAIVRNTRPPAAQGTKW
jgi:transcriptional regulator with GAF, ATPase, and Fis domain